MSIDAQLARIRRSIETKSKNGNRQADEDPLHELTSNTVTKSHALSRAYYRLSITEKRCMEALISKLHPMRSDNQLQDIELSATEYAKTFPDVGKHAYDHLAAAADALVHRVITIDSPIDGVDREKLTLMARAQYMKTKGRVICTFNPLIVPHLLGLRKKFSSYPLNKAVNFSSTYTWRFYELLSSWAQPKSKVGNRFVGWIDHQSVDELREMLGVPDSYSWSKFDKQVLQVASKELKKKSNIYVTISRYKTGRKITHLNIKFIDDDQQQLPLSGGDTADN